MAAPDPLIGHTLDARYRLSARLGEGGMGAVYRATHVLMDKPVAVKVLSGSIATDPAAARRFQREARSASRLDHENCIRVTDFGATPEGIWYLVMELLSGRTLGDELRARGALGTADATRWASDMARALAHAHGQGVLHRDLKPENVFLAERADDPRRRTVKVLDFGLAKMVDDRGLGVPTLTETGIIFGTPEYLSPEQARGEPLDARSDLYSLGVLLYQMVTGTLPFQAPTPVDVATMHLTRAPQPPRLRRPDLAIPDALDALVLAMMAKSVNARPATAGVVAEALDALAVDPGPVSRRVSRSVASRTTEELASASDSASASASDSIDDDDHDRRDTDGHRLGEVQRAAAPAHARPASLAAPALLDDDAPPATSGLRPLLVAAGLLVLAGGTVVAMATLGRDTASRATAFAPRSAAAPRAMVGPAPSPPSSAPVETASVTPDTRTTPAAASAPPAPRPAPDLSPRARAREHLDEAARWARRGNRIKALYHLDQAARLVPDDRDVRYRLGAALLDSGQHARGCRELAQAGELAAATTLRERAGCLE